MRLLLVTVLIASLLCIASCDESVENESKDSKVEENSVKKKRSYHGFYGPYTRYTSIFKTPVSTYALTPGNAIVHSFNVNYPKVFLPKPVARPILPPPVLYHTKPTLSIPSVPIYANRYPVFVQSPVVYQKPFSTLPSPAFIPSAPAIPPSYPGFLPQSTSDGWRPIYSSAPYFPHTHINQPSNTVLPPLNPTHLPAPSQTQTPNNYYLPPSQSIQQQDPQTAGNICLHIILQ